MTWLKCTTCRPGLYDDRGNLLGQTWLGATGHVGVMPVVGKELVRKFPPASGDPATSSSPTIPGFATGRRRISSSSRPPSTVIGSSASPSTACITSISAAARVRPQRGGVRGRSDYSPDAPASSWRAERGPAGHPHAQRPLQREGHGRHSRAAPAGWVGPRRSRALPAITGSMTCGGRRRDHRALGAVDRAGIRALPKGRFVKSMPVEIGGTDEPGKIQLALTIADDTSPPTSQAPVRRSAGPSTRR